MKSFDRILGVIAAIGLFISSLAIYLSNGHNYKGTGRYVSAEEAKWQGAAGITFSIVIVTLLLVRKKPPK